MVFRIKRSSRLRFSQRLSVPVTGTNLDFWDIVVYPEIPEQTDDIEYEVKSTDRIDKLASDFYGDPVLWWVIAIANDFELLPPDLKAHTTIRIPSPRFVNEGLFNLVPRSV